MVRAGSIHESDRVTPLSNPEGMTVLMDNVPPGECAWIEVLDAAGNFAFDDGACVTTVLTPFACQGRCWPDGGCCK